MMCPLRASGSYCADCYSTCAFRDNSNLDQPCLLAQACAAYVKAQKEEEKIREEMSRDIEPWEYNWGGVE